VDRGAFRTLRNTLSFYRLDSVWRAKGTAIHPAQGNALWTKGTFLPDLRPNGPKIHQIGLEPLVRWTGCASRNSTITRALPWPGRMRALSGRSYCMQCAECTRWIAAKKKAKKLKNCVRLKPFAVPKGRKFAQPRETPSLLHTSFWMHDREGRLRSFSALRY
jgi:hypothetical protein